MLRPKRKKNWCFLIYFVTKIFKKLIIRLEISGKNRIFRYYYFHRNKWGIASKLKKEGPGNFLVKKILKKKLGLITTILRKYRRLQTYIHTYTHTHIQTFFKNRFFRFLRSQNVLICQKIKNQNFAYHNGSSIWGTKKCIY